LAAKSPSIESIYRTESRRAFATLVRLLGDFDLAEDALHEAFATAVEQWPREGMPENPLAWLVSTARFKAIDVLRRRAKFASSLAVVATRQERLNQGQTSETDESVEDDQLRLIFTCCHPSLSPETQIALTLREVCGLSTEEIATAFLTTPSTIAQRIVRGKAKIRTAKIPYQIPTRVDLPDRLESVLAVIYLVFNEGYAASAGPSLTRAELSEEAIRLGRLLADLLPDAEVLGLLALMLLHESRRPARTDAAGDVVLLEEQDRSLWNRERIGEGQTLVARAIAEPTFGTYTIQAAIASEHARTATASETDWGRIVAWYDLHLQADPSPVVELNRAVAVAMRSGPEAGIAIIDAILNRGELTEYHLAHAARADLCRRLGWREEARESIHKALALSQLEPERRFLERRLRELS
jgi:RNA polymerase sigma-70 factor (ECF subfamily)